MEIGGLFIPFDGKVIFWEGFCSCVIILTANVGLSSASRAEEASYSTLLAVRLASLCVLFAFLRCFPTRFFAILLAFLSEIFWYRPFRDFDSSATLSLDYVASCFLSLTLGMFWISAIATSAASVAVNCIFALFL